jgi:cytochrome c
MSKEKDLEFNKLAAAILLTGLVAMMSGFFADVLYQNDHRHDKRGYEVDVSEAQESSIKVKKLDINLLIKQANAENALKTIKKCAACHSFDKNGSHKIGPNLWNVIGNKIANKSGYQYSSALSSKKVKWNYSEMYQFLKSPRKYAKGTKMSFAGIKKDTDLANVIEYLRLKSDIPVSK